MGTPGDGLTVTGALGRGSFMALSPYPKGLARLQGGSVSTGCPQAWQDCLVRGPPHPCQSEAGRWAAAAAICTNQLGSERLASAVSQARG